MGMRAIAPGLSVVLFHLLFRNVLPRGNFNHQSISGICPQEFLASAYGLARASSGSARAWVALGRHTSSDRKRIKELERELLRKDRALAGTAALLVLSKKVSAIFHRGEDE